jgi:hypothetical protein
MTGEWHVIDFSVAQRNNTAYMEIVVASVTTAAVA